MAQRVTEEIYHFLNNFDLMTNGCSPHGENFNRFSNLQHPKNNFPTSPFGGMRGKKTFMKLRNIYLAAVIALGITACSDNDNDTPVTPDVPVVEKFAKGADVSWLTQMEKQGMKFYNANGRQTEGMQLMQELGMNAIRLRVWVNPADGWCNAGDMLVKAIRANELGLRLMIDFHYSDSWADPAKQDKPSAWASLTFDELKTAVATHTTQVLTLLKTHNITPEWVQVGNETGNGMLWPDGEASKNMAQYAALNNAGYDAVKAVFPSAKVIVHLQNGHNNNLFRWLFDGLKNNGGKWDVIGMSLYPNLLADTPWKTTNDNCVTNIEDMISRYNSEVMICEVGYDVSDPLTAKAFLSDLIGRTQAIANDKCLGVFYWEPQAYNSWNGYNMGAFDTNGQPTAAMDAFK